LCGERYTLCHGTHSSHGRFLGALDPQRTVRFNLVWGGLGAVTPTSKAPLALLKDGGRYDPVRSTWRPVTNPPAPALAGQSAVWTGSELILWGGEPRSAFSPTVPLLDRRVPFSNTGWRYRPATDDWRPTVFVPPGPRWS
jgi:hypothetical protein